MLSPNGSNPGGIRMERSKRWGGRAAVAAATLAALALAGPGPAAATITPTFVNHVAPPGLGNSAAEPTIGVNWVTGNVMYLAGTQTLRVSNFQPGGGATWSDVSALITSITTFDPILYTDLATHRTFVSQLLANCSLMAYTDDDGATWVQNPLGCGIVSGSDHQSVGGGPYAAPMTGSIFYPNTVYYCASAGSSANCARSDNGGLTFGFALRAYSSCVGLHGHLRSAPDGTVYLPNFSCTGRQAVVVSEDNGQTWDIRRIPGSHVNGESDPSVAVGAGGTVYFGWEEGTGTGNTHPFVAVSHDKGQTWENLTDVGAAFGIQNVQFPEVIAGDDDRAAFAFLGTPTGGNDQLASFTGLWHLYVAVTYDGGATWTTVDATPTDPVQRGCIWLFGGGNPCRNLLDFNDITVDAEGRILVAYADGCTGSCATGGPNTRTDKAVIARQSGGTGLFSAFD